MNIETIVSNIALTMTGTPKVYWGAGYEHNLILDGVETAETFPIILMYPSIVKFEMDDYGSTQTMYIVTLSFITKTPVLEDQDTKSKATIQSMRAMAFEFSSKAKEYMKSLGNQNVFPSSGLIHSIDPIKKLDTNMFFDQYDLNVGGCGLTIEIPYLELIKDCT